MPVASNILLQMNAKIGKPIWRVHKDVPSLKNKSIAIGGLPIYHKLISNNQSCAAFVGTTNTDLNRYSSHAKLMGQNAQRIEPLA